MGSIKDELNQEFETLRTLRDELRVQANLGAAEAKDLFESLEHKWSQAEAKLRVLEGESREVIDNVGDALGVLRDEIRDGYRSLRNLV